MACNCMERRGAAASGQMVDRPGTKRPEEPCVFCAEKHLSTAYALAQEGGYEGKNRLRMIGELVLAQWHLWLDHRAIAVKIRDLRHAVQSWKQPADGLWDAASAEVQALTRAEAGRLAAADAAASPEPAPAKA